MQGDCEGQSTGHLHDHRCHRRRGDGPGAPEPDPHRRQEGHLLPAVSRGSPSEHAEATDPAFDCVQSHQRHVGPEGAGLGQDGPPDHRVLPHHHLLRRGAGDHLGGGHQTRISERERHRAERLAQVRGRSDLAARSYQVTIETRYT